MKHKRHKQPCVAYAFGMTPSELEKSLSEIPNWKIENERLARTIEFPSYSAGAAFAMRVVVLAEKTDHHPNIEILWKKVRLVYTTHSAGGLSQKDFMAAVQIEKMLNEKPGA